MTPLLDKTLPFVRLSAAPVVLEDQLGPLPGLVGSWVGTKGWNLIAVPEN